MPETEAKRINLKSKRKRTLLRKAIEISQLSCELDIFILIRDNQSKKIYQYNSGGINKEPFDISKAVAALMQAADGSY